MRHSLTLGYISNKYHISVPTLSKRFQHYLQSPPDPKDYLQTILKQDKHLLSGYLQVDGSYFGDRVLMIYWDSIGGLIFWSWSGEETAQRLKSDVDILLHYHYPLYGLVSDGKRAVLSLSQRLSIPYQRCQVHVQRMVMSLVTQRPKTQAGRELRELASFLHTVKLEREAVVWLLWYRRLWQRHYHFFTQKSGGYNLKLQRYQWWYTHKHLRRAYYHIRYALPYLFTFLQPEISDMPKTNNALEGFFSQLNNKVSIHRGLSQTNKESLISWYLYLRKFSKKPTLKLN